MRARQLYFAEELTLLNLKIKDRKTCYSFTKRRASGIFGGWSGGVEWRGRGVDSGSLATGIGLVTAWYGHGTALLSTLYRPGLRVLVRLLRLR